MSGITLSGCTQIDISSESDFFEKKQECAKYKDAMLKDWMDINNDWMSSTWDPYKLNIEEIFYSEKNDSCLYVLSIKKYVDLIVDNEYKAYILLNMYVYDYLTKQLILSTEDLSEDSFNISLQQLKWK